MTWAQHHQESERASAEAHLARRSGDLSSAKSLFDRAAEAELKAIALLDPASKPRTYGITAVSAAALLYKSERVAEAEIFAHSILSRADLPEFATDQLKELLQTIWNEQVQASAGVRFVPGQVTVSVDGGEVVRGGAPLDLIVERVQTIQSLFYRTAEFLKKLPLRRHGPATKPIQELCRPWLFQSVPGSYQFTVAIQGPAQGDMFKADEPEPRLVASTFMTILEGAATDPENALQNVVPDTEYRSTFLKLARNLAPTGRSFSQLEIRSSQGSGPVVLTQDSRKAMTRSIRQQAPVAVAGNQIEPTILRGVLRAVHLEKDWLELNVEDKLLHISGVGETLDDVIGPLVNHAVIVQAIADAKGAYVFRDIELDDGATDV